MNLRLGIATNRLPDEASAQPAINNNITIGSGYNGHWMHVFQNPNTQWLHIFERRIFAGNFYIGLQASSAHIYDAQIPKGAFIKSATQTVQAYQTSSALPVNVPMNTPNRVNYRTLPLVKPFEPYLGWRFSLWTNWDMHIRDLSTATIEETSNGVNNRNWIIRQITAPGATIPNRAKIAQRFTVITTTTVGSVILEMRRTGLPVGFGRLQIQGETTQLGQVIPDDTPLAVSDDKLLFTIPTIFSSQTFNFTGGNQVSLSPGNYYMVFEADYPSNNADYVTLKAQDQWFTVGRAYHYGEGLGLDWQNYPGLADCNQATQLNDLSTNVMWNMPQFIANQNYTSPDIKELIQVQVSAPWYTPDSGIIISQGFPNSGNANRIWKSAFYASMPVLNVEYTT